MVKDRIGFIEIVEQHPISGVCQMADPGKFSVTLFYDQEVARIAPSTFSDDRIEKIQLPKGLSRIQFLRQISSGKYGTFNLFFVNTIRDWAFSFFRPPAPVIARLYNLRLWFDTYPLPSTLKQLKACFSPRFLENPLCGYFFRKRILKHLSGIVLEYPKMAEYINSIRKWNKPMWFLPIKPYVRTVAPSTPGTIKLVIPGGVVPFRRDYFTVLDAFYELSIRSSRKLSLHFLGRCVPKDASAIIERVQVLKSSGLEILLEYDYVSEERYEQVMQEADIIISPLMPTFSPSYQKSETYSLTKGSGIFSDFTRFGKPILIPDFIAIADEFRSGLHHYHNRTDLIEFLERLSNNPLDLDKLKSAARNSAEQFSVQSCQKRFENIYLQVSHEFSNQISYS